MNFSETTKHFISVFVCSFLIFCNAYSQVRISGNVTDSNGEALPYTTVRLINTTIGCTTDNNGNFSFIGPVDNQTLMISSVGYEDYKLELSPKTHFPLKVVLKSTTIVGYVISEVEVKPEKEVYKKKDNPAVELAKTLIDNKKKGNPNNNDFVSKDRYEKFVIALDNFSEEKQKNFLFRRFDFLKEYVDTSLVSGKPILNVSLRELVATDYYQKKPSREKQQIFGRKWVGIDDFMHDEEIRAIVEATLVDVDLFNEKVIILRNEFVSPLSDIAPSYYKYYIMDTLIVDNEECIDFVFVPFNSESFGFTGHFYVTTDSTHFIKWVQMSIPYDINLNFVEYLNLEQRFTRTSEHQRLLLYESITTELKLYDFIDGIYGRREVTYSNYKFNDEVDQTIFSRPERVIEDENATNRDEKFWVAHRDSTMSIQQRSVHEMLIRLRDNPVYYWTEQGISFLFSGYVPIKKERTPYYYGPVNTTISYNELEGIRLRTGGMTTAYLSPHLFGRYYIVYGTRDQRWKYMGRLEYSFKPKKENWNEFPIHSLRLHYENDIIQYGQTYLYTNKDNMFLSLKRLPDNKIGYIKLGEFTYSNEFHNGFSYSAVLRNRINESSRFIKLKKDLSGNIPSFDKQIMQTEFEINLRYAPNEKFVQHKWDRNSVLPEHPVFTLSHSMAFKNIMGSDYTIQKTNASYRQRLWVSPFGYFDVLLKGEKIWNQAPYPLLIIPNANISYTLRKESYELMTPMEFILDSQAAWDVTYYLNGWLFNRTPMIKKLKLREVITCRGIWGTISDYNNPNFDNSGNLYKYPETAIATKMTEPYVELGFGIENILKFGRIDYYRRLTYKDTPCVATEGIRISVHMQF